ncbi:DUF1559 family PulG-like putative transporter [Thalassoglobus polymorphus]|uniref:DUF1559 domain-containing protein n=1 Tax=Thalassoglobus polymorphus TaxID=2527994 RepID=A0A517QQ59_9PLAN|nr:DUF1559 domain-containing protein [Thalassoglobus polymorphus]QDT33770.1 hypothetical protein Mal48_30250 [Thalassoglobus polymorphus]
MRTLSLTSFLMLAICLHGCGGGDKPADSPADGGATTEGLDDPMDSSSLGAPGEMPSTDPPAANETAAANEAPSASSSGSAEAASPDGSTLNYVPEDAVAVLIVRPSKVLSNPLVKEMITLMDQANPREKVEEKMADFADEVGVKPEQVDHVLVVVDKNMLDMAPMIAAGGARPSPVVVVQLAPGVSSQLILDSVPQGESIEIAGGTGVTTPDGGVLFKVSDSRLVYSSKENLDSVLKNASSGKVKAMVSKSAASDLALAVDLEPVKVLLQDAMKQNPNPPGMVMTMVMPIVTQLQTLSLGADLEAANILEVNVSTPNVDAAQGVHGMLNGFLGMGKQQYEQAKGEIPEEMQAMAKQLVDGAELSTSDTIVSLTLPRPENFEKLPEMLKPAFAEAAEAAKRAQKRNDIKQIGLAFHNYHDVYQHFPAVDSNGEKDEAGVRGKGLSWRVHLLPFLEYAPLYEKFNLDEAWDSEHNKALIAEMPAVFGDNPEGKTSIHVFVGENLAFNEGKPGARIRDYTDGTSNTILAVKAGDDTAEIWTKPGGLKFNAEDPFAALGNIGEVFMVLLCDGSTRDLSKDLDKTTFSNLIQQNDGNPVDF